MSITASINEGHMLIMKLFLPAVVSLVSVGKKKGTRNALLYDSIILNVSLRLVPNNAIGCFSMRLHTENEK